MKSAKARFRCSAPTSADSSASASRMARTRIASRSEPERPATHLLVGHLLEVAHRGLEPELLLHHLEELVVLAHRLRVEERDVLLGAALALEVDGQQVRPGGDQEPDHLAAVAGVGHERGDRGEDPVLGAGVALLLAVAERRVGLVDHHAHRRQRGEDLQDALQVRLGRAHPHRAEVAQLDAREADLGGEALDEEGLGAPHRAADQVAHRHRRRVAAHDGARRAAQALLDRRHPGHHRQVVLGLDVFEQPQPLGLDHFLLEQAHRRRGEPVAGRLGAVEELGELRPGDAGQELGQPPGRQLRVLLVPARRARRLQVLQALGGVGALDLELARRVRAHELGIELGQALGDQHDHDVLRQEHRVLRPLAQVDEHRAVLRRAVGGVAGRRQGLGEGQHEDHRPRRLARRAVAEVGVEQREAVGGVARQPVGPGRAVHRVVGLEALQEVAAGVGRGEAQPLGPVVGQNGGPAGEELAVQELVERAGSAARPSPAPAPGPRARRG